MALSRQQKHLYEFGRFSLDVSNRLLYRDGQSVPLHPKAFDTLLLLVERRDEVLGKEELMQQLWPDSFVEESNLTQNIYVLRKTLGLDTGGPDFIKTVPKRGYKFVGEVREVGGDVELIVEEQTTSRVTIEERGEAPLEYYVSEGCAHRGLRDNLGAVLVRGGNRRRSRWPPSL